MVDETKPEAEQAPPQNPEDNFIDPILGVLFVHGIGDQKRGETVPWGGDPLYQWLRRWFRIEESPNPTPNIYLTNTRLARPIPSERDAPPYAHLRFKGFSPQKGPPDQEWILAESYWAQEFTPPSYGETVPFALVVAPLILERIATETIGRLLDVIRRPSSVGDFGWSALKLLVKFVSFVLVFLLGSLIQLFMVGITVLAIIPFLSAVVPKLQLHLAGWLGDAYLMAVSPTRLSAMVSQIRRDIAWLVSKESGGGCCKAVAVIAHSGGAVIAHKALMQPDAPDFDAPVLLITYGSGQRKVNIMEQFNARGLAVSRASPVLRIISATCVLISLLLLLQENPSWLFIAGFGIAGIVIQLGLYAWLQSTNKGTDGMAPYRPAKPKGGEWVDYAAVADIVRDNPICATGPEGVESTVTERINNLHSPLKDHSGYWHNDEEFLSNVARLLYKKALDRDLVRPGDAPALFVEAKKHRERRVLGILTATLLLVGSLPGIWVGLEPWLGDTLGESLRSFFLNLIPRQSLPAVGTTTDACCMIPTSDLVWFWGHVFGLLSLCALLVLLGQQGLLAIWRGWSSAEEDAFFKGEDCTGDPVSVRLKVLFSLSMIIAPLVASLLLLIRFLAEPHVLEPLPALLFWPVAIVTLAILLVAIADAVSTWRDTPPGRALHEVDEPPCSDTPSKETGPTGPDITEQLLARISNNLEDARKKQAETNGGTTSALPTSQPAMPSPSLES
jgi:hypothetical protein